MLKSKTITINKTKYTISELTPRVMLPIMKSDDSDEIGIEMAKMSVSVGGKPMGDKILDLGMSVFTQLVNAVNEVNGAPEVQGKD